MGEAAYFLLILLVQSLVLAGLAWAAWRWLRSRRPSETPRGVEPDGAGGWVVPLRAAFTGIRWLPWLALASNNAAPRLVVTPAGLTIRVIRQRHRRFAEIEGVDLRHFGGSVVLSFRFVGSVFTFEASLGNTALAREVLRLLPPGVPLSARATALRHTEGSCGVTPPVR